jgi:hypothetical protein
MGSSDDIGCRTTDVPSTSTYSYYPPDGWGIMRVGLHVAQFYKREVVKIPEFNLSLGRGAVAP